MTDLVSAMDPEVRALLERRAASSRPLWDKTPEEARRSRAARNAQGGRHSSVAGRDEVIERGDHDLPIRIYDGRRGDDLVIVFFHGGGFVTGDLDTHHEQAVMLGETTGRTVVSVDYRLAPEHRHTAALGDAYDAVDWVRSAPGAVMLGIREPRVAVAGMSAGANLAANASREFARRGAPVIAQLLAYPWLDATQDSPSRRLFADGLGLSGRMMQWYLGHVFPDAASRHDPAFSPLRDARFDRLPPTVLSVAMLDPLRDDALAYGERLEQAGVPVTVQLCDDLPHGFWGMTGNSPGAAAAAAEFCARFSALLDENASA